ncbi:HNH endonuclease signature motif containing protein [Microbacterium halotolerans]|uniref:HNH endonuclease signature motif containing protein n=1 Tax=Microbacterium halotolerans TaxID=246613 RepID=UPI000E6AB504|nr:HNH endonuclease signature motif containing protein [Microbacterium halotolerans]
MDDASTEDRLTGLGPDELTEAREHVNRIDELRRGIARAEGEIAQRTAALARIAHAQGERSHNSDDPEYARRAMAAEVAAATRVHPNTARAQLDDAERLTDGFPTTLRALQEGRISRQHAKVIADAGANLDKGARASLDTQAAGFAETRTPGEMKKIAKQRAAELAPRSLRQRHLDAREQRRVSVTDLDDGMSELCVLMPTFHAHAIHDRLTAMARQINDERRQARKLLRERHGDASEDDWAVTGTGDTDDAVRASDRRTFDQIRADLAADLILSAAPTGHALHTIGSDSALANVTAQVQVTIPASMVLDRDHGTSWNERGALIDPDAALAAAARTAGWDRLFRSPDTGEILATDRYRPTADQRRRLIARDATCRFPGCTAPARDCDLDHSREYARGGQTSLDNLAALCRAHHVMRHQSDWRIRQLGGGLLEWTSPTGRIYVDEPVSTVAFREAPHADEPEQTATADAGAGTVADTSTDAHAAATTTPDTGVGTDAGSRTSAAVRTDADTVAAAAADAAIDADAGAAANPTLTATASVAETRAATSVVWAIPDDSDLPPFAADAPASDAGGASAHASSVDGAATDTIPLVELAAALDAANTEVPAAVLRGRPNTVDLAASLDRASSSPLPPAMIEFSAAERTWLSRCHAMLGRAGSDEPLTAARSSRATSGGPRVDFRRGEGSLVLEHGALGASLTTHGR